MEQIKEELMLYVAGEEIEEEEILKRLRRINKWLTKKELKEILRSDGWTYKKGKWRATWKHKSSKKAKGLKLLSNLIKDSKDIIKLDLIKNELQRRRYRLNKQEIEDYLLQKGYKGVIGRINGEEKLELFYLRRILK